MNTNQMNLEKHEFPELIKISEKEVDICGIKLPRNTKPPFCNLKESDFPEFIKDRHFLDLLRRLAINKKHGQHTCIMSAPGVGKTDVLKYFGFLLNVPVVLLSCSEETKATELEGKYVPNTKDARTFFEDKLSPAKRHLLKDTSKKILEEVEAEVRKYTSEQASLEGKGNLSEEEKGYLQALKARLETILPRRNEAIIKNEGWNLENIEWTFSPGVLPRAIEDNALLILDEWNKVSPGVRELLNAVIAKPNYPETYGTSKFVSYANGGGEYVVGDQFLVVAAVNFPDPASARYPFHEAEMRRLDLQILENLPSKEAIERNVGKRTQYARTSRQEDLATLKNKYALGLRSANLPLDTDRRLESLLDMVESIVEQAAHVIEQVGVRQSQEITLVGARDIIFDFLFNVQFKDFSEGILFALDHYFLNKIIDPDKRRDVKTKIEQIVTMGDFKKKITTLINKYEKGKQYPKEVLAKMEEIKKLLDMENILEGIVDLAGNVRDVYRQVPDKEKTIDGALEFLEDTRDFEGKDLAFFAELERSIIETKDWIKEYTLGKEQEQAYVSFAKDTEDFLSTASKPKGVSVAHESLEKLSEAGEAIYYSPDSINELLQKVSANTMKISEKELARMRSLIPKELPTEMKERLAKMKEHTEGKKPPLLMVLPKEVVIGGKAVPFTIEKLEKRIWPGIDNSKWKEKRKNNLKHLYLSSLVTSDTKRQQWGHSFTAYTSACLAGSKNKRHTEQIEFVRKELGSDSEIRADMYLAMVLHYLQTGKLLMNTDKMRLHELDNDGDPLVVCCRDDNLWLSIDDTAADAYIGIGSSFVFSSSFAEATADRLKTSDVGS